MWYCLKVDKNDRLLALELAKSLGYDVTGCSNPTEYLVILLDNKQKLYWANYPYFERDNWKQVNVKEWIECLKGNYPKRTITIDGKTIELSEESYQNLKEKLT